MTSRIVLFLLAGGAFFAPSHRLSFWWLWPWWWWNEKWVMDRSFTTASDTKRSRQKMGTSFAWHRVVHLTLHIAHHENRFGNKNSDNALLFTMFRPIMRKICLHHHFMKHPHLVLSSTCSLATTSLKTNLQAAWIYWHPYLATQKEGVLQLFQAFGSLKFQGGWQSRRVHKLLGVLAWIIKAEISSSSSTNGNMEEDPTRKRTLPCDNLPPDCVCYSYYLKLSLVGDLIDCGSHDVAFLSKV